MIIGVAHITFRLIQRPADICLSCFLFFAQEVLRNFPRLSHYCYDSIIFLPQFDCFLFEKFND